jgi:hypothetical protein
MIFLLKEAEEWQPFLAILVEQISHVRSVVVPLHPTGLQNTNRSAEK